MMHKSYKELAAEIAFLARVLAAALDLMERDGTEGQTARMCTRRDWSTDICNQLAKRIQALRDKLRKL